MRKGNIVFLAGLLACSVAGVATASAMLATKAQIPPISGDTESVLILKWGDDCDVTQISELKAGEPEYRRVTVLGPKKSASANDGKFTATLSADASGVVDTEHKSASIEGLSISIYDKAFDQYGNPGAGATKVGDLDEEHLSVSEVVGSSVVSKTYYFKIEISSEAYAQYADSSYAYELAAKIHLTYGENA